MVSTRQQHKQHGEGDSLPQLPKPALALQSEAIPGEEDSTIAKWPPPAPRFYKEPSSRRVKEGRAEGEAVDWAGLPDSCLLCVFECLNAEKATDAMHNASATCTTWREAFLEVALGDTAQSRPVRPPLPKDPVQEKTLAATMATTCAAVCATSKSETNGGEASSGRCHRAPAAVVDAAGDAAEHSGGGRAPGILLPSAAPAAAALQVPPPAQRRLRAAAAAAAGDAAFADGPSAAAGDSSGLSPRLWLRHLRDWHMQSAGQRQQRQVNYQQQRRVAGGDTVLQQQPADTAAAAAALSDHHQELLRRPSTSEQQQDTTEVVQPTTAQAAHPQEAAAAAAAGGRHSGKRHRASASRPSAALLARRGGAGDQRDLTASDRTAAAAATGPAHPAAATFKQHQRQPHLERPRKVPKTTCTFEQQQQQEEEEETASPAAAAAAAGHGGRADRVGRSTGRQRQQRVQHQSDIRQQQQQQPADSTEAVAQGEAVDLHPQAGAPRGGGGGSSSVGQQGSRGTQHPDSQGGWGWMLGAPLEVVGRWWRPRHS